MVTGSNGTENLGIQLDRIERHAVVYAKIERLTHRATSIAERISSEPWSQGYDAVRCPRMTQQGHSWTSSGGYCPLLR